MRLTDLKPEFVQYQNRGDRQIYHLVVKSLAEAHGVMFLCPKCFQTNGGSVGTHLVVCWSRSAGTPDTAQPLPGRWAMAGTGLKDLTLNADIGGNGNRSVQLLGGCDAHFHVNGGEIAFA